MKLHLRAGLCGAVAAALALSAAAARADISMQFTGVVSPGSLGEVFPYGSEPLSTSFDGQPVQISLTIAGPPSALYVSSFSTSWSQQSYSAPFITGWSGTGLPQSPENDTVPAFYSTVVLGPNGGSISIFPTSGFIAYTDSDFDLSLTYALSHPQNPYGSFTDTGLTGSGSFSAFKTFVFDPNLGAYDASSTGQFTLSSLTQTGVPEPSTWAMLILGLGLIGLAARLHAKAPVTT